jgi:AraC-like DNA-binding protein
MAPADLERADSAALPRDLANSLIWLLECASRNLEADPETAIASIARASSLLQIEIDRKASGAAERVRTGALAGWQVRRVMAYVDAHLEAPIHICDLAAVVQRSSAYFCRAFKRTFGETPLTFIRGRRLHRASELMLTSDAALSEIAIACGFSDQAHLCKLFRSSHDQSPAAWRRERRNLRPQNVVGDRPSPAPVDTTPMRLTG